MKYSIAMESHEKAPKDKILLKTIYSKIEPNLNRFTIEELEKALKELDNF